MPNVSTFMGNTDNQLVSAVFLTFSGNCKEALTYYQTCFGGFLQFKHLEEELPGYEVSPVVSGVLMADDITIFGSDMVHNEGRIVGNYMAIFKRCASAGEREQLAKKLDKADLPGKNYNQNLIEIVDAYSVRWILSV